jgi:hypothetical protein
MELSMSGQDKDDLLCLSYTVKKFKTPDTFSEKFRNKRRSIRIQRWCPLSRPSACILAPFLTIGIHESDTRKVGY